MHYKEVDKVYRKKVRRQLHENAKGYIEQILGATSLKITAVRPHTSHLWNSPKKTNKGLHALKPKTFLLLYQKFVFFFFSSCDEEIK